MYTDYEHLYYNSLYHSGVKGMKWGIRKDSKRTASLRQQYRSEKDSYKKELLKAKYQDSKIRDRIDQNGLSKRQEKLKNKYMAKGMSKQSAEIAAVKRTDLEKKLLIGSALAGSVAAAYAYRNHLRYTTGDTLDENSVIGRITTYAANEKTSGFYVYTNKKDRDKYNTLIVGEHMLRGHFAGSDYKGELFRKSFKATGKIKIASPNEFNKIAYNQYKTDKDFKDRIDSLVPSLGSKMAQIKYDANGKLSEREIGDIVNRANLYRSDNSLNKSYNKIYDSLKKKGYSGFIDINDRKYSGYNSKRPTVIIDTDKVRQTGAKEIDDILKQSAYLGYVEESMRTVYKKAAVGMMQTFGVLAAPVIGIRTVTKNKAIKRSAVNYYKRTNDSSKGLNEASKLEEQHQIEKRRKQYYSSY